MDLELLPLGTAQHLLHKLNDSRHITRKDLDEL